MRGLWEYLKEGTWIISIAQIKQLEAGSQIPLFKLQLEARNKTTLKDTATIAAKLVTESKTNHKSVLTQNQRES